MANMRQSLGLGEAYAPWTSRPEIRLRGLPAQFNSCNFQNECLDLRFARWCVNNGRPCDTDEFPGYLMTDVRQHVQRNGISGKVTLLTGSNVYWYLKDRILVPEEHLFSLGWGDDVQLSGIERSLDGSKRSRKTSNHKHKTKDLAGNAMALPCLASVVYAGLLASDTSVFSEPCTDSAHGSTDGPLQILGIGSDFSRVELPDDELD